MTDTASPRVIVAMDFANEAAARALADRLDPASCRLKVGKELFVRAGPALVERWVHEGWDVFLDLKFHDIPNTAAAACKAAADLGVWMVNVHALGGSAMLRAARAAVGDAPGRPLLTAVTILTSHDDASLDEVGVRGPASAAVDRLADLAASCGLDGVVCSTHEASGLRARHGSRFRLVTPGVRPSSAEAGDQRRVMTPEQGVAAGATDLVIGRPITRASDPLAALRAINRAIGN